MISTRALTLRQTSLLCMGLGLLLGLAAVQAAHLIDRYTPFLTRELWIFSFGFLIYALIVRLSLRCAQILMPALIQTFALTVLWAVYVLGYLPTDSMTRFEPGFYSSLLFWAAMPFIFGKGSPRDWFTPLGISANVRAMGLMAIIWIALAFALGFLLILISEWIYLDDRQVEGAYFSLYFALICGMAPWLAHLDLSALPQRWAHLASRVAMQLVFAGFLGFVLVCCGYLIVGLLFSARALPYGDLNTALHISFFSALILHLTAQPTPSALELDPSHKRGVLIRALILVFALLIMLMILSKNLANFGWLPSRVFLVGYETTILMGLLLQISGAWRGTKPLFEGISLMALAVLLWCAAYHTPLVDATGWSAESQLSRARAGIPLELESIDLHRLEHDWGRAGQRMIDEIHALQGRTGDYYLK